MTKERRFAIVYAAQYQRLSMGTYFFFSEILNFQKTFFAVKNATKIQNISIIQQIKYV